MTAQTTKTMTGPEAYAKAVAYAQEAERIVTDDIYHQSHDQVTAFAAVSQAYAAIAQAAPRNSH